MSEKTTRESMVFYNSFYEAIKHLPAEEFKKSACAIFEYGFSGDAPKSYGIEYSVFTLVKLQIDTNNKRWNNAKKSHSGKKSSNYEAVEAAADDTQKKLTQQAVILSQEPEIFTAEENCDDIFEEIASPAPHEVVDEKVSEQVSDEHENTESTFSNVEEITSSFDFKASVPNDTKQSRTDTLPAKQAQNYSAPQNENKESLGEYDNVFLSVKEKISLIQDMGVDGMMEAVNFLSRYLKRKPFHRSVCHYEDIRGWVTRALEERKQKAPVPAKDAGFDIEFEDIYEK